MKLTTKTSLVIISIMAAFSNASLAANNGSLGKTSAGSSYLSISKLPTAEVTNLTSDSLQANNVDAALSSGVCVYSTTGDYNITAEGDGKNNQFILKNGDKNIAYSVDWKLANHSTRSLQAGKSSDFSAGSCTSASKEAELSIHVQHADISRDKSYTGTLTLIVSPY